MVELPPVLVAVTVYVTAEEVAVGVPEITPVDASSERPAGSVAEIDHDVTVPPLDVGVAVTIGVSFVNVRKLGL